MYKYLTIKKKGGRMSKCNSFFGKGNILNLLAKRSGGVHFVGVGGVSMSALACLSCYFGINVSAEDREKNSRTRFLEQFGVTVYKEGEMPLPPDTVLVVYSLAIDENSRSVSEAESKGIACVSRAEYMSALAEIYRMHIGVCGSHGKSTVTAMINRIFNYAGRNPTTLSGASLSLEDNHFHIGSLDWFLYEACEYKDSFLHFEPEIGVFLNLELDHTDYFKDISHIKESFSRAIQKAKLPIINADDVNLREITGKLKAPTVFVGTCKECFYRYELTKRSDGGMTLSFFRGGGYLGEIHLNMRGDFNASNAACAVAAAMESGISFHTCSEALSKFYGIKGRLEYIGNYCGNRVYHDYAHHPTEIKCGIKALKRDTGNAVTVIFGPHTYSRTAYFWSDFVDALKMADKVLLTEIDAVRERKIAGISAKGLADAVGGIVIRSSADLKRSLVDTHGDIAVMGAIDMRWIIEELTQNT